MGKPRWDGSLWILAVQLCPVCHKQLDACAACLDGICWDHDEIIAGIDVDVHAPAGPILAELGQAARQEGRPEE